MSQAPVFTPTDFVASLNQTFDYAYPQVFIQGELANYRVSKNRWLYFKLRDEHASVQFFGTVYQRKHELQEGMMLQVRGYPRLHPQYGFSVQVQFLNPVGEGSIKQAADLLMEKLKKEGLFDPAKKRVIPLPPSRIGLVTSEESAAYQDFLKVLNARWSGVEIVVYNVQVQGEPAAEDIAQAIRQLNEQYGETMDVLVVTRGGGSPEDLAAFSTETVTRAVAGSAIPTLVAVGHETDISLAELAADQRASTPSNAAEMLVPNRSDVYAALRQARQRASSYVGSAIQAQRAYLQEWRSRLAQLTADHLARQREDLSHLKQLVSLLHPNAALSRGYAIVRRGEDKTIIPSGEALQPDQDVIIEFRDAEAQALVQSVHMKREQDRDE